jgi:hypothetical protein
MKEQLVKSLESLKKDFEDMRSKQGEYQKNQELQRQLEAIVKDYENLKLKLIELEQAKKVSDQERMKSDEMKQKLFSERTFLA